MRQEIKSTDTMSVKTIIFDPVPDMEAFERENDHIPEGDYKNGLRTHLIADVVYTRYLQEKILDLSKEDEGVVTLRDNKLTDRRVVEGKSNIQSIMYPSYDMMNAILFRKMGIMESDLERYIQKMEEYLLPEDMEAIRKFVKMTPDMLLEDTEFISKDMVEALIQEIQTACKEYLAKVAA